jgi:hypothetical protein
MKYPIAFVLPKNLSSKFPTNRFSVFDVRTESSIPVEILTVQVSMITLRVDTDTHFEPKSETLSEQAANPTSNKNKNSFFIGLPLNYCAK